jgi:hypothetical protein
MLAIPAIAPLKHPARLSIKRGTGCAVERPFLILHLE